MSETTTGRAPGRPRSERADKAILDATLDLLARESGVAGVSMEAVAARAGVGKSTIYRRWPSKEALIVDALGAAKAPLPEPSGASAREDLTEIARALAAERGRRHLQCFWNVLGSAGRYPELYARYKKDIIEPRRAIVRDVLRRGVATGELRADLDIEVAMSMLVGSLTPRRPRETFPEGYAEAVVDALVKGIGSARD
ncbi:TetR/AcrR family transcriptional regulator [Actinomadura livida]|uniref:AcrR family transcriptional regulator n=1 Tax=Actinomadura livida TaxID=79909 RepID=A0A7W7IGI6_9ACTN|nr:MULTISPECIES: TetR/AcrR family transcriptional regulator [Actinomadura]MBB4776564.1 AcrR family transcriptional regulator [Actinomadura catellatispora]GGT93197.1 TetR family transcriptional regulator [Actinomadura livida]